MVMTFHAMCGDHIEKAARDAIATASQHNRQVRMRFNGCRVTVNKRLSVRHVVTTWQKMMDANSARYRNSTSGKAAASRRQKEIDEKQDTLDDLIADMPKTKEDAMPWLAKWCQLSDDIAVDKHANTVADALKAIGFVAGQHVGDPAFKSGKASRMLRIEYIGGQVIAMIESVGCVHPMIGDWAAEVDPHSVAG